MGAASKSDMLGVDGREVSYSFCLEVSGRDIDKYPGWLLSALLRPVVMTLLTNTTITSKTTCTNSCIETGPFNRSDVSDWTANPPP